MRSRRADRPSTGESSALNRSEARTSIGSVRRWEAVVSQLGNGFSRRLGISVLYQSRVGVKPLNQLFSSDMLDHYAEGEDLVNPHELFLGIDGLDDDHTLLGTPLASSPHAELAEVLAAGGDPRRTTYVHRARAGTLDLRGPCRASQRYLRSLVAAHERCAREVTANEHPVVTVYTVGGVRYLGDGKHRAALALEKGSDVIVRDATPFLHDSYFAWLERKMRSRPNRFKRHLELFDRFDLEFTGGAI